MTHLIARSVEKAKVQKHFPIADFPLIFIAFQLGADPDGSLSDVGVHAKIKDDVIRKRPKLYFRHMTQRQRLAIHRHRANFKQICRFIRRRLLCERTKCGAHRQDEHCQNISQFDHITAQLKKFIPPNPDDQALFRKSPAFDLPDGGCQ